MLLLQNKYLISSSTLELLSFTTYCSPIHNFLFLSYFSSNNKDIQLNPFQYPLSKKFFHNLCLWLLYYRRLDIQIITKMNLMNFVLFIAKIILCGIIIQLFILLRLLLLNLSICCGNIQSNKNHRLLLETKVRCHSNLLYLHC